MEEEMQDNHEMGEAPGNTAPTGASPPSSGRVASGREPPAKGRAWRCGKCGCEAEIPPEVPADAEIVCPMCAPAPAPPKRGKVAIVGFADSWNHAPFHHAEWDIWCLNQFYDLVGGWTGGKVDLAKIAAEGRLRWFDIHSRHDLECDPNVITRHPDHLQKLREMTCPVVMQQHHEDVPNSVEYPLDRMTARFGRYWTNSISYMIALAIDEGYREMGLYGVNLAQETEYAGQRPSCEYMIGFARGVGITVHIPVQSDLLKAPYLYGYEDDKADAFIAKLDQMMSEHQAKMVRHAQLRDENEAYHQQFNGAVQQLQAMKRAWTIGR